MTPTSQPFFVICTQRSGSTLLRLMLNCHSRLCVPFESAFITKIYYRLHEFGDLSQRDNLEKLIYEIGSDRFVIKGNLLPDPQKILAKAPQTYGQVIAAMFSHLAQRNGKVRWGDKTPAYVTEMDILWNLFPNAKFVHLVRDGRDVALSLRGISWGTGHLPRSAESWQRKTELVHKMGAMIPGNFLEIRYEDLVLDAEKTLREICIFLGEAFEPQMLRYHENAREQIPEQSLQWHHNSTAELNPEKVFEWKRIMSKNDRIIFESIAGDSLELFGYERENRASTWSTRLKKLTYYLSTG